MAGIAIRARKKGYEVPGSDTSCYAPIKSILENGKHKKTDRRVTQPISKLTVIKDITKEKPLNSNASV